MITPSARHAFAAVLFAGAVLTSPVIAQDAVPLDAEGTPSLMAQQPETPQDYLNATLLMLRVTRPDLAAGYLQQLVQMNVDDETLLGLQREQGTSVFLRLAQMPELRPHAQQLLDQLRAAVDRRKNDPSYMDDLVTKLQGSPRERAAALTELRQFGADAVPPLLARLSDRSQAGQPELLVRTIAELGHPAAAPLIAALDSPDERTRATACEALGWVGDEQDAVHLLGPSFSKDESPLVQAAARNALARIRYGRTDGAQRLHDLGASDQLRRAALSRFNGEYEWPRGPEGEVDVWSWDSAAGNVVKTPTSEESARLFSGQRLARQALQLSPTNKNQALFLATSLAEEAERAGWENPWPEGPGSAHDLAVTAGPDLCESALQLALENNSPGAAVGCLKALGQTATRSDLFPRGERPSAIISALNSPNERVQFAATSAIMQIDPDQSFPSAHRVVEILTQALSGDSAPQSVVIDPNPQRGNETAGMLRQLGYDSRLATTGRDGFRVASERSRMDLAVLHLNTIHWDLTQTVANFRADSRTAGVPIVVVGPVECEPSVQRLVERTPDSTYLIMNDDADNWSTQLEPLLAQASTPALTPEQRKNRGAVAAYWLREIAERNRTDVFPLIPAEEELARAINSSDLALDALVALSAIPRPSVQRRLLEAAENSILDEATREEAARQLATHIRRFGNLLSREELGRLNDAANNIESIPMKSAVLGSLSPAPEEALGRLRAHALPEAPPARQPMGN